MNVRESKDPLHLCQQSYGWAEHFLNLAEFFMDTVGRVYHSEMHIFKQDIRMRRHEGV